MPARRSLRLFADHQQIHLLDASSSPAFADAWTQQATDDRLAVAEGGIAVGTADSVDVTVSVASLAAPPGPLAQDDAADHVTEGSLRLASGKLVVMGCTDYFPDARRIPLAAGTYRVRVAHAGLARGKERIEVQLWPAALTKPRVLKRWKPPPPKVQPALGARPPRTARKAAECVRAGKLAVALPVLEKLANGGDVEASLSLAQICAFRRDDEAAVKRAVALFDHPDTFGACNPFDEMGDLVRRAVLRKAARESATRPEATVEAQRFLETHARKVPVLRHGLLDGEPDGSSAVKEPEPGAQASYDAWVASARSRPDFRDHPADFAAHRLKIACNARLEAEVLALWADPVLPRGFEEGVTVARWLAFRGRDDDAWATLESLLPTWWPVFSYQVAPVELLRDRWLSPLVTPDRAERVLATPRGAEADL